jgi:hypothetical protein
MATDAFLLRIAQGCAMRVLHFSSWDQRSESARYARHLVACLQQKDVISDVYPPRRYHRLLQADDDIRGVCARLLVLANSADLVHIQHEFAGFGGRRGYTRSVRLFGWLVRQLHQRGIPLVVTFHNDPILASRYQRVLWRWQVARHFRRSGDRRLAIVLTRRSRQVLIDSGFDAAQVKLVPKANARTMAMRHLGIYGALVHQPLGQSATSQLHTRLELGQTPSVADLFSGRGVTR